MGVRFSATATVNTQAVMNALSRALKPAVLEAADLIQQAAKSYVPVDTGALQESIHIEEIADGPFYYEVSIHPAEFASNKWGFDPAYARRIEYGFVGMDSLGRMYNQAPQPYVRPAWDSERQNAESAVKNGLAGAV
jgi:hypothetical protein